MKTLLVRFFRYAKSTGIYPCYLTNPVTDLLVDPGGRLTTAQLRTIYRAAPTWGEAITPNQASGNIF